MQLKLITATLRDLLQSTLFAAMSNHNWLNWFKLSPLSILNKASLGLVSIVLAGFQCYFFYQAVNKNFEAWLNTLSAVIGTGLTSIASYGELIAASLGIGFAAGIWIFLAGLTVNWLNQMLDLGINLYRAFEAKGSAQRQHYLQAAIQHGFNATYLALTITALVCTFLLAVNPVIVTGFCLGVVGFGLLNIAWRIGSNAVKEQLKQGIGLSKVEQTVQPQAGNELTHSPRIKTLLSSRDFIAELKSLPVKDRQAVLELKIDEKLASLRKNPNSRPKIANKISVLGLLRNNIGASKEMIAKTVLANQYPGAFQSFWREKSDVEQLYDALSYHHSKSDDHRLSP